MDDGLWTIEDLEQRIAHRRAFFFPGAEAAMGSVDIRPLAVTDARTLAQLYAENREFLAPFEPIRPDALVNRHLVPRI